MSRAVVAVGAVALVAGVLVLREATMSTHQPGVIGTATEVVVEASTRGAPTSATIGEMTATLVRACRLEVHADLGADGVVEVAPSSFRFTLHPGLDESDRRQLDGCLEDALVDHLQLDVRRMGRISVPPRE